MDNPQRPWVPKKPTPNTVVMDDAYDEQENYYSTNESFELCRWTDVIRPCTYLKKATMTPNHKKISPRREDL
jgi:hypothetical protein